MTHTLSTVPIWRAIQRENFVRLKPLMDFLQLDLSLRKELIEPPNFALNLPKRLAEKIEKNTLTDPILRQFVPLKFELDNHPEFVLDPVEDQNFREQTRLLQKYRGRALLLTTSACAMHCRYCFRQNLDYGLIEDFSYELERIKEDTSIHEVILSGGDPLSLSDEKLSSLLEKLESFDHVTKIRFHTRFPIGIPERITPSFLSLLSQKRVQFFFVFHINHPKELDEDVLRAIAQIRNLGHITLNQAVLLKGVNDNNETQLELHQILCNHGILPYYLHQLDRVQGAAHFEVEPQRGHKIIEYLRSHLPGYGVPRYVQEIPHKPNKMPMRED